MPVPFVFAGVVLRTLQPVYTSPVYCQVRSALTVYIIGTRASGYLSWSGVDDSTKAKYISADQLPLFVFRLQLCGGPYIPRSPFHRTWLGRGMALSIALEMKARTTLYRKESCSQNS